MSNPKTVPKSINNGSHRTASNDTTTHRPSNIPLSSSPEHPYAPLKYVAAPKEHPLTQPKYPAALLDHPDASPDYSASLRYHLPYIIITFLHTHLAQPRKHLSLPELRLLCYSTKHNTMRPPTLSSY